MRKTVGSLALVILLSMALCVSILAGATTPEVSGIYAVNGKSGISMTPQTAAKVNGTPTDIGDYLGFCANTERIEVTYTGAETGKFYCVFVTNTELTTAPTNADIVYIDQTTATAGSVSFNAYPSNLVPGTYYVYLASNATSGYGKDGLEQVGTFQYYMKPTPGDVDGDKDVDSVDALCALQMAVDKGGPWADWQREAANVYGDSRVTATDALWILEASVGNRTLD